MTSPSSIYLKKGYQMAITPTVHSQYTNVQVDRLFHHYFSEKKDVQLLPMIPKKSLNETLSTLLKKRVVKVKESKTAKNRVLIPLLLNGNHCSLVYLHYGKNTLSPERITYFDPGGHQLPKPIDTLLRKLYTKAAIDIPKAKLQFKNEDPGLIIIEYARALLKSGSLSSEDIDLQKARNEHVQILEKKNHQDRSSEVSAPLENIQEPDYQDLISPILKQQLSEYERLSTPSSQSTKKIDDLQMQLEAFVSEQKELGEIEFEKSHNDDALKHYSKAYAVGKILYRNKAIPLSAVVQILHQIALSYRRQCKFNMALDLQKQLLEIKTKLYGNDHPDVAETQMSLATLYHDLANLEKSEECYKKVLTICKKSSEKQPPLLPRCLANLAVLHTEQGLFSKALERYQEALAIYRNSNEDNNSKVGIIYNNMAVVYNRQGKYREALEFFEQALKILKAFYGETHQNVAWALYYSSYVYKNQRKHEELLVRLKQALAIFENLYGKEHRSVARVLNSIGNAYVSQKKYEKSLEYYKESISIKGKLLGKNHLEYANTLHCLAQVYNKMGNNSVAQQEARKATQIFIKVFGDKHSAVANAFHFFSELYFEQGDYQNALVYARKCMEAASEMDPYHHKIAEYQIYLATVLIQFGLHGNDDSKAMKNFQAARETLEKVLAKDKVLIEKHADEIESYDLVGHNKLVDKLAKAYLLLDMPKKAAGLYFERAKAFGKYPIVALRHLKEARSIYKTLKGEEETYSSALELTAEICYKQKQLVVAIKYLSKAVALFPSSKTKTRLSQWQKELEETQRGLDADLWAQFERMVESSYEVKDLYLSDLEKGNKLSKESNNRTTELIIKFRNILDQCYGRFLRECIYSKNNYPKIGRENYFSPASSKDALINQLKDSEVYVSSVKLKIASFDLSKRTPKSLTKEIHSELKRLHYLGPKGRLTKRFNPSLSTLFSDFHPMYFPYLQQLKDLLARQSPDTLITPGVIADRGNGVVQTVKPPEKDAILEAFKSKGYLKPFKNASGIEETNFWTLSDTCKIKDPDFQLNLGSGFSLFEPLLLHLLRRASLEDYPKCEEVLFKHQPFAYYNEAKNKEKAFWKDSWLDKVSYIGNDSKHVRLTPQHMKGELSHRFGTISLQEVKIQIEYVESDLYTWTFVPYLNSLKNDEEKISLSRKIYTILKNPEVGVIGEVRGRRLIIDPIIKEIIETPLNQTKKIEKLKKQFEEKIYKHLAGFQEEQIALVIALLFRRAEQQSYIRREPDAMMNVEKLLDRALQGTQEILETFCAARKSLTPWVKVPLPTPQPPLSTQDSQIKTLEKRLTTTVCTNLRTVKEHHQSLKMLSTMLYQNENNGVMQASEHFMKAAMKLEDQYPFLATVYYRKAMRGYKRHRQCSKKVIEAGIRIKRLLSTRGLFEKGYLLLKNALQHRNEVNESQSLKKEKENYKKRHAYIDDDSLSQMVHLEFGLEKLKYACFKSTLRPHDPHLKVQIHNQIVEMAIKLHHLLDQSLTRFANAMIFPPGEKKQLHFPCVGSEKGLLKKLTKDGMMDTNRASFRNFSMLLTKLKAAQPFREESWWSRVYTLSIEAKHVRINLNEGKKLVVDEKMEKIEDFYTLPFASKVLFSWTFKGLGSQELSERIIQKLTESNYLKARKPDKTKVKHSKEFGSENLVENIFQELTKAGYLLKKKPPKETEEPHKVSEVDPMLLRINHKSTPEDMRRYVFSLRMGAPKKELIQKRKKAFDHFERSLEILKLSSELAQEIFQVVVYHLQVACIVPSGKVNYINPPLPLDRYVKALRKGVTPKDLERLRKGAESGLRKSLQKYKLSKQDIQSILDKLVSYMRMALGDMKVTSNETIQILKVLDEAVRETRSLIEAFFATMKKVRT